MIGTILGLIIAGILIFLLIKAIGNIFKGILFILLAFLIYYLFSSSIYSLVSSFQPVGNFLKTPVDKIKSFFYSFEIVTASKSKEGLAIVIRNNGILPLSDFNVKIDGKETKVINNIGILFPRQIGIIEVDWKGEYNIIEVSTKERKITYISPL